ncbi:protein longifolia 1 [Tanacetum coccineum]
MGKTSKFFKSLFGFKPSNPKRLCCSLFKSSHKQHNHDEAILADGGSVQSRPPSVVEKLMGLEALPDSAITIQKQEMGVTPISPPFCVVASKVKKDTFQPNDDQHREAVGEVKKATYRGTQVSREVSLIEPVSEVAMGGSGELDDSIQVIKDQWEMPDDVIPNTLSFGVSSEINRKKMQNIEHLVQKLTRLNSTHDEAHTDYIASLYEKTKPDDRYISEILLASGLLLRVLGSTLTTFEFHSSGHPINPLLFNTPKLGRSGILNIRENYITDQ